MENRIPKERPIKERPIAEAVLESSEVIADVLMRGDAFAEIPLIGTAIKICKAADSIRDRAFALKLSKFILNLDGVTEEQKAKLKEKLNAAAEETQKIGETLFLVLERVTDLDKPSLLAQIFLAYIDGVISGEELRRLSQAIDIAFSDDIHSLVTAGTIKTKMEGPWMQNLVTSGLTQLRTGENAGEISNKLYCEISPLGKTLRAAYSHVNSSSLNSQKI